MQHMVLALLLSAGPIAFGQSNPSASQRPNPTAGNSVLTFTAPSLARGHGAVPPAVSILTATHPDLSWTYLASPQSKPTIPAQIFSSGQNPVQFLALNQIAPPAIPNPSSRVKAEPIPTTWPNAHFENIPTNWPGLKYLLIDQSLPAKKATDSNTK